MIQYFSAREILLIHSLIIDKTGGSHGVRDRNILLSLVDAPKQKVFGKELYPTLHLKAAVYTRNVIFFHPFVDGNKRTAMTLAGVFLENNGYIFKAEKGEIEHFALQIIKEKLEVETIAEWFDKHCIKTNT